MFLLPDYDAPWRRLIHSKYGLHAVRVFDMKDEKGRSNRLFESPDGGRPPLRWPVLLVWAPAASRAKPRAPPARKTASEQAPDEPLVTTGSAAKVRAASGPLKAAQFARALQVEYERSPYLSSLKEELMAAPHQRTDTFRMVDDIIWRVAEGRYQLVLAQDSPLRELVMREAHESPAAWHTGRDKTLDRALAIQGRGLKRDLLRADHSLRCLGATPAAVKQRTEYPEGQPLSSSRGDTSRHERTRPS
eukprot:gene12986-biopygen13380